MNLRGRVYNGLSHLPLAGVQIFSLTKAGDCKPIGTTDAIGYYQVQTVDSVSGIIFAAQGFQSLMADPGFLDQNEVKLMPGSTPAEIAAENDSATPPGVGAKVVSGLVTPSIPTWVWIAGAGLVLISLGSKKKSVGAAGDFAPYILPIGLVIGGYFLVKNLFGGLGDLFTGANTSNASAIQQQSTNATAAALSQAQQQGIQQTKTDAQLSGAATTISTLGSKTIGQGSSADQDSIVNTIIQSADNITDYLKIKQFFGVKQVATGWLSTCYALGFNCDAVDLDAFLHLVLDESHIDSLRNYFGSQQINYSL